LTSVRTFAVQPAVFPILQIVNRIAKPRLPSLDNLVMLRTSARKPAQLGLLFLLPELKEPSLNRERTPELPMNEPVEFSPSSKSTAPLTASSDFWCRRSTRLLLFFLHLVFLIVAVSFTPGSHAFELGQVAGLILILGCLFSWAVLYHAQSPTLVAIFAGVAIAQIAFHSFCRTAISVRGESTSSCLSRCGQVTAAGSCHGGALLHGPAF